MKPYLICPTCGADDVMKNDTTRRGKQHHQGRDCGRQFVEKPQWQPQDKDPSALIDRLWLERLPFAGSARVLQLAESWLQQYVNQTDEQVPQQAVVVPKTTARLTVQMDEWWSFVDDKGNKQWVWLAMDVGTRASIGGRGGDRSQPSAQVLWDALPRRDRQAARLYTDDGEAYACV